MIEFKNRGGQPVLVNPDRVLWAEAVPSELLTHNLVIGVSMVIDARGQAQVS